MEIGETEEVIIVEPIQDPFEVPETQPEKPEPVKVPAKEREKVPA